MNKRFQVFVSSTFADLQDERKAVIQALMEMDCIPAGMELFPAADEEQFKFIQRIIDDCDYYVLIIGGRYGSTTSEGLSYTEQEYDYARSRGVQVLAFVHENPGKISLDKSELDPLMRERLSIFRDKARTGKLVKHWIEPKELPGMVALSLSKAIKLYPAVGWVRADQLAQSDALADINRLRQLNDELTERLRELAPPEANSNLAGFNDPFDIVGTHHQRQMSPRNWALRVTWAEMFAAFAPRLMENPNDASAHLFFNVVVHDIYRKKLGDDNGNFQVNEQSYQTAKIQFIALNLVQVRYSATVGGSMGLFWNLTKRGNSVMMELRSVRKIN